MENLHVVHSKQSLSLNTTTVYVGVGSNICPRREICRGLDLLTEFFGPLIVSPAYRCEAIGFNGPDFINLVVSFETALSVTEIISLLRRIEAEREPCRQRRKFDSRVLDLDLLLYGDLRIRKAGIELPRADIHEYAHVLWPLADIAPKSIHPVILVSYYSLKANFTSSDEIERISFLWQGKFLPIFQQGIQR